MSDVDGIGTDSAVGDVGDIVVAQALAQAVREIGRSLATEPRRVQGLVNDVLGAESRTRRAEIDAVVLAAEESIPEDLLADRIDVRDAQDRLHDRGLDEGVALFAVEVWRYALGMLAADAQPPSLRDSLNTSSRPAITDPAPASLTDPSPVGRPDLTSDEVADVVAVDAAGIDGDTSDESSHTMRRWLVGSAAVAAAMVLVAAVGAALWLGRDNGNDAEAVAASTLPASTTIATSTTVPAVFDVIFDVEPTPLGDLTRTWHLEDDELVATLSFANNTETATTGRYYEVVPKSLAATADLIVSEPAHTVYKEDPVVGWDLTIEPGATSEITYTVAVDAGVTAEALEVMKSDQLADAAAFVVERDTPPALAFVTPNDQTVASGLVTIAGTVDPTATVTFAGQLITVNPDGSWSMTGELPPGPNTLTFVATSRYGVAFSADFRIIVEPPVEEALPPVVPVAPATTAPGTSGHGPTTTTAPQPPSQPLPPGPTTTAPAPPPPPPVVETTTPAPPPPPPAPISVSVSGRSTVTSSTECNYTYSASASGFSPVSYRWSNGETTGSPSTIITFTGSGSTSVTVTATGPDGRTASASMHVQVQQSVVSGPVVC